MSTESPPRVRGSLILTVVRWLGLPLRSRQFWIVQAGVVLVAFRVEIGNLAILNSVAFIVGQRVEREGQARLRAEAALRASEVAEARYRALFDEQRRGRSVGFGDHA